MVVMTQPVEGEVSGLCLPWFTTVRVSRVVLSANRRKGGLSTSPLPIPIYQMVMERESKEKLPTCLWPHGVC